MRALKRYKAARLSLEDLVTAANELLPDVLPHDISDQRIKEELTSRLVRHYSSQGSLEEPLKEGREARYTYRHLLQLLALRRLQAEGHRTGTVASLTAGMSEAELEDLVTGLRQVSLSQTSNSAVDFLQGLRAGGQQPTYPSVSPTPTTREARWVHYKLAPGLVLQVRDDYRPPSDTTPLLTQIQKALIQHQGQRRSSR